MCMRVQIDDNVSYHHFLRNPSIVALKCIIHRHAISSAIALNYTIIPHLSSYRPRGCPRSAVTHNSPYYVSWTHTILSPTAPFPPFNCTLADFATSCAQPRNCVNLHRLDLLVRVCLSSPSLSWSAWHERRQNYCSVFIKFQILTGLQTHYRNAITRLGRQTELTLRAAATFFRRHAFYRRTSFATLRLFFRMRTSSILKKGGPSTLSASDIFCPQNYLLAVHPNSSKQRVFLYVQTATKRSHCSH